MNSVVSMGTLLGQLFAMVLLLVLGVMAVRFLMAATRLMNTRTRLLEKQADDGASGADGPT